MPWSTFTVRLEEDGTNVDSKINYSILILRTTVGVRILESDNVSASSFT